MDYAEESLRYIPNLRPTHTDTATRFSVTIILFQENVDIDNSCKAILDAMKYRVYWDDSQVHELHAYRAEVCGAPGCQVTVTY